MQEISPETPEERAKRGAVRSRFDRSLDRVRPGSKAFAVLKRVAVGVYSDGFIHAGNLAYLALLTLFPFFIILAALAQFFGHGPDTLRAIDSFLRTVPPAVAQLLRQPIMDVLAARTGSLLWLGALVGLWTVGSFIETIRDILRRAYGTGYSRAFWHYRMTSAALIIVSVVMALAAFSAQVLLTAAEQFITRLLPFASDMGRWIGLGRLAPLAMLAVALYFLFYSLTPSKYRLSACPKWPGAMFTALWWMSVTMALPHALALLGGYDRTYGGLAGTIIALFFFWLVGFGLVIGAHLNAALAETPGSRVREAPDTA
ncbi:YihY/virulence factor BrkB family protein [Sphingomonas profundi]|uniref:YihY/virulence factor BrkB family protein n=1 Tax=Alterirhizorhabdus profundi TaxID=2681549 RepID=UPI0012E8E26E|nr:YihY/virulence factor BrkB family protein [Sphingomonas profundi]